MLKEGLVVGIHEGSGASRDRLVRIPVEVSRTEDLSVQEVQSQLSDLLMSRLEDPVVQTKAYSLLRETQEESLHVQNPVTGEKFPINTSLLPVVISSEAERRLMESIQVSNIVRSAVLLQMNEDEHLRNFFESGVDPLAVEIMRQNPYTVQKAQWRFRADTIANPNGMSLHMIENNGGEPQGDSVISDSIRLVEKVLGVCLDLPEDQEVRISPYPDEQMMQVLIARYRLATGKNDNPTIGYLAWSGRSFISGVEARSTSARYAEKYGQQAFQFDPLDIVDIKEQVSPKGKNYYTLVCKSADAVDDSEVVEIDMVRRLCAEPMENLDLWKQFRERNGKELCSDGKETIWERFVTKLGEQMINPLNSYATDKKLDVILGNPDLLEHFKIWDRVEKMLQDREILRALSINSAVKDAYETNGIAVLQETLDGITLPAYMLRTKDAGLYTGDELGKESCLSEAEIEEIKTHRSEWVLKRSSLAGHSGNAVHVGSGFLLHELDREDYLAMEEAELSRLSGFSRSELAQLWNSDERSIRSRIAEISSRLDHEDIDVMRDRIWPRLIENSLNKPDALIQASVLTEEVPVILFTGDNENHSLLRTAMNFDCNPQSIGPTVFTYPAIRITSQVKTNVTGGYGGHGVAMSESMARSVLGYAQAKGYGRSN